MHEKHSDKNYKSTFISNNCKETKTIASDMGQKKLLANLCLDHLGDSTFLLLITF